MAIFQSDAKRFRKKFGRFTREEGGWGCVCDACGVATTKWAEDPGFAHEQALKEGFVPVATAKPEEGKPMNWACYSCSNKI